ncbi:MAG: cobaltochelatase subunit CobN [Candidatus Methanomethylophilaceae archaeon]|nr:cobaltochelatase subunit CobN [Candidatus Methanomethylophilaceae archaeon]
MREYHSEPSGGKEVRLVYLSVGGTNFSASLGDICSSERYEGAGLGLRTFESAETERDPVEFSLLKDSAEDCDLLIVNIHGDPSGYKRYDDLKAFVQKKGVNMFLLCFMEESMREAAPMFKGSPEEYLDLHRYLSLGGVANRRNLLRFVCRTYGGGSVEADPPHQERMQGVYHRGMPRDVCLDEYLGSLDPGRPTVGVMISQGSWLNSSTGPHDLLIDRIEAHGANTIPVFLSVVPSDIDGSIGIRRSIQSFFCKDGRRLVDAVVLCGMGFSTLALGNPGDGSGEGRINFFEELGVPILAAFAMFRPKADWERDGIGMEGGELCISVAMPEVDGQLTTVPFVFREKDADGREYLSWEEDRIDRIARMAVRWAKVHSKPRRDRKVSILLNGGSLSNASIGEAGGLDSLESVCRLLERMEAEGYLLDRVPRSSRELIDELLDSITNSLEWDDAGTIESKAVDFISKDRYLGWASREVPSYSEWVCRNWGEPVGEIMSHKGKIIVPGVMNGNVYIGYEPERGKHAQAESLIHDPDLSTPHSYLGMYRWISEVFGTDIHIHIGTHGSVEWLPGKGNGLSRSCFPDIMMDDIPNLYLYVIDDPSEGIVAKRRKKSVLVDYLMPSLARAGTYEDLGDLEGHIQGCLFAKQTMQRSKMESEAEAVSELIGKLSMWDELGIPEGSSAEEVASRCESIFDYVTELKDGLMTNGLHVAGQVPEGEKLDEMIYCLTRLKNGRVPSLRYSIARSKGYDLDSLLDDMSGIDERSGMLNGQIVDAIDGEMQESISAIRSLGYELGPCLEMMAGRFGGGEDIAGVTEYICGTLYPNILGIEDELSNMICGMDGGYVPPGPSGSPSRGNAHLLPTGKNYYSLDPETVPSQESWKVGRKMADDMVRLYIEREGKYPESVGIVVWSIDTMKTGGDDVAYILYLLGIRPVWGSVGGKITGLEVMPKEELQRPRIDVTVRMSSLFRDTFPNLFQLIDEAVHMASEVEESDEDNYLRKHLKADMAEMIKSGMSREEAVERSLIRVFGEPPGTHGAGVNVLVESSKWKDVSDLAQIYITCGCSAYGRNWRGEKMPELFRRRLTGLDVAVKNQVDREIDLIDVDDGYAYLGGINAVARAAGREKPVNYLCDTSDPDRIKTRDLEHEIAYMLRTRVLNPKWVESMKEHGFSGANWVHEDINHVFGWDATSDVIEPWMYQSLTEHFLFDDENREWIKRENPYALRDILEDLLEAVDRGMWEPEEDVLDRMRDIYLEAEGALEEAASARKGVLDA